MTQDPYERNKDSRKASKSTIEQPEPPLDKTDPTEPVKVSGEEERKGVEGP